MALGPGSIAFVGFNADGQGTRDAVGFVLLEAATGSQVIYFTDNEWTGSAFNAGESFFSWTAPVAGLAAGSVVVLDDINRGSPFAGDPTASVGTSAYLNVAGNSNTGFSAGGEILYAYTAASPTDAPTFLTAIGTGGLTADGATLAGTGLTNGTNALAFANGASIAVYAGARDSQTSLSGYAAILNNSANWQSQPNSGGDQSNDGITPDVPTSGISFGTTAFTIAANETHSVGFGGGSLNLVQDEGNAGNTAYVFTVERAGGATGATDFSGTIAVTGATGDDFGGTLQTVFSGTIAAGTTSTTVTINVNGDTTPELTETFALTLTSASNSAGIATSISATASVANASIVNEDFAVPPLVAGDIAFVGLNADGNDNLAFVALKAIAAGSTIFVQDNEWTGAGFNIGEGAFAWTASAAIAAGTVVTIDTINSAAPTSALGTIQYVDGANPGFGAGGEIVYAFVGTSATAPTAFLAAIATDGFEVAADSATLAGTGLTAGVNATEFVGGLDIMAYNGSRASQPTFADYAATLATAANFSTQNAGGDQGIDGVFPDVPFDATAFTLAPAGQAIGFAANSLTVARPEGDSAPRSVTFTVTRTGGTTGQLDFAGSIAAGTTDAADFGGTAPTAFNGSIFAGAASGTVTITFTGDTMIETNESFSLTLTGGTNSLLASVTVTAASATATATIVNDDATLSIGGIAVYDAAASLQGSVTTPVASDDVVLVRLGSIQGTVAGAESIAYENGRVYATNSAGNAINVHSVTAAGTLVNEAPISLAGLPSYLNGGVNSVDVKNGVIAVGYENANTAMAGFVALFNAADNSLIKTIQVGILPDDVTFTPDGSKLLVANEGEALTAIGTVSIIDLSGGAANAFVTNTIGFTSLNGAEAVLRDRGLAIFAGQPAAGDIEPEYITISADGTRAYVTIQEVNGIAVIDLTDPAADRPIAIQPLGTVDRNLPGNALDTSDQDGGNILRNVNVVSLIQPDAIASFDVGGVTYFVTANEGDARVNVTDTVRFGSSGYVLDPTLFPNAAALKANTDLGRLNVQTNVGDTDGDGDFDVVHAQGGRGISIFRQEADGSITKVRETGGEFEAITAALIPANFNSNQSVATSSRDTRSDDKGPEPEGVTIGVVNGRTYAFVGLERVGGYMVYDVTDPANAVFVTYRPQTAQDLGPETSVFVAAADSPTGEYLLLSAQEISNTVTLYSVQTQSAGDDVINGAADNDSFNGRGGNDTINGNGGNDSIDGGAGNDTLNGGDGIDTASYASATAGVNVNLGTGIGRGPGADVDTLDGFEDLLGSAFDDVLFGDGGDNAVNGGAGNDILHGARGNDTVTGGAGNDIVQGGVGSDVFSFATVSNGAVDIIIDFAVGAGDQISFGAGVSVTAASVSFLSTAATVNGVDLQNGARSLDLVLTLSSGDASQTVHILDAYGFAFNAYWEGVLGLDLSYPQPLPSGGELAPIA